MFIATMHNLYPVEILSLTLRARGMGLYVNSTNPCYHTTIINSFSGYDTGRRRYCAELRHLSGYQQTGLQDLGR